MGINSQNSTSDRDNALVEVVGGNSPNYTADVILDGGKKKIAVDASVSVNVNELLGDTIYPFTYFTVTAAPVSSTYTVVISDDSVSVVTTVTATEADDLHLAAELIIDTLNADATFKALYKAYKDDCARVFVQTKYDRAGECHARFDVGDFVVNVAGGSAVTVAYDTIEQRAIPLAIHPFPADRTKGTVNIEGSVSVSARSVTDYFSEKGEDSGSSTDMTVDGSSTPVNFNVMSNATLDTIITEIRLSIEDGNVVFSKFMDITALTNGLKLEIKTDGVIASFTPTMKTTNDVVLLFNSGGLDTFIHLNKRFIGTFKPDNPFILKAGAIDYVRLVVQDDLRGLVACEYSVKGYFL